MGPVMGVIDLPSEKRRKPWALTFFSLLAMGGLIAMPFLAGEPDGEKMPDIVRFLGHFHPVLLHLPIGVFSLILFQELGAIFGRRNPEPRQTSLFPMFFGAASAIVAVIAGLLLYHGDDYAGSALAERHLWGGLIFAVVAVLTFIVKAWTVALSGNTAFYRLLLFGSVGVMGFASHDGASITHGENYLTVYAPDPIRKILGLEPKGEKKTKAKSAAPVAPAPGDAPAAAPAGTAPAAGAAGAPPLAAAAAAVPNPSVYADIVHPIFERRCVQCHKEGKAKGKYRMDSYEKLVKGGKEGAGLVIGKSAESNVVVRMNLPEDDEEHMPPEGKPDVEAHELEVIKWWIDNGADEKKALSEYDLPAPIKEAIAKIAPGGAAPAGGEAAVDEKETAASGDESSPHGSASGQPDAALKASVAGLSKDYPGALSFESQQSALLTFTAVSLRASLDDAGFKKLESVSPQFVTVDLSATRVTDQSVAQLATAKNLRLIRLAETDITDAAIDTLVQLHALESINLYGTKVTDAGVSKLAALPSLKRLYLWKTTVTPEAIKALKEKLPACEIITGAES